MSPTDGTVKRCDDGWLRMRWRAHSSRAQRRVRRSTKAVLANSARLCALLKSFPSRYPLPPHGGSMLRSFASTLVSSGMCLLFPLLVEAQASSFSIGTASAAPGQKSTGYLEVPAGVDAATNIPVIVINGEKRGPVLALVSGAHGTEYTSIIPIEMVLAFGLDHIMIWRARPADLAATRYLDNTSSARGKPSIVVEAGYAGTVDADDVALLVDGTFSTMRALKMLSGNPRHVENPVWLDRVVDVLSDGPGIWYPLVKRGTYVQEGMKIGFVTDYFGKLILEARAPVSGVILHINAVPSLKKGDNIADIAAVAAHAP